MKHVTGCNPSVELDGRSCLGSASEISDLGDAQAEDGQCHTRRKAGVTVKLDGYRFVATQMALLPK